MNAFENKAALTQTEAWQQTYRAGIRDEAIQHHSFLAYHDDNNRLVREYPVTGEIYEVSTDGTTLTLLSVHGRAVGPAERVVKSITDIAELNKALVTAY